MSYRNPVYSRDFADPFVLKHRGVYWAYCTGFQADGRVFGILRSTDLVHWDYSGGAMDALPGTHTCYWAPEVTYEDDGSFLMYYSVGNEEHMVIRVARAEHPSGPFRDVGIELTHEPFAIDAHVFKDEDGGRYLFYATDFLTHSRIGTGTVVARMRNPYSLDTEPVPVTRARYDWQVYDPKRESKGGVRWHTVEGPFVLKRKGLYYQMFSGGNWQNISYGVSFAVSDQILRSDEWHQHADGETVLPILRTLPGKVIGPGHNSVVRGPNNRDLYCVYHEWVNNQRVLAIDRLDWRGEELVVLGPTTDEQFGPCLPQSPIDEVELQALKKIDLAGSSALLEFSLKPGLDTALEIAFEAHDGAQVFVQRLEASGSLLPDVWHNVRIELDQRSLAVRVGDTIARSTTVLSAPATALHLRPTGAPLVSSFELTRGWEELFTMTETAVLLLHGWEPADLAPFDVDGKKLRCVTTKQSATLIKALGTNGDVEIVVNLRLLEGTGDSTAEVILGMADDELIFELSSEAGAEVARLSRKSVLLSERRIQTAYAQYHQLRVLSANGDTAVALDDQSLSMLPFTAGQQLALRVVGGAAFDMVRVTEIASH